MDQSAISERSRQGMTAHKSTVRSAHKTSPLTPAGLGRSQSTAFKSLRILPQSSDQCDPSTTGQSELPESTDMFFRVRALVSRRALCAESTRGSAQAILLAMACNDTC